MPPLSSNGLLVLLLLLPKYLGSVLLADSGVSFINSRPLNFVERAGKHGYEAEKHTIITEDGYLLTVFRVTKSLRCQEARKRTPVLLMHGLLLDADGWLDAGPKAGLAYLLADACWDTWVGSVRGTSNSRRHVFLDPDRNKEFWHFSVDEIGEYDIPAMIDHVLKVTGVQQLNYIGFSQGCSTFLVMCSEKPGYCEKAKVLIALAPATTHVNTKSLMFKLIPQIIMRHRKTIEDLGIWEIFAKRLPTYEFFSNACIHKEASNFCRWVLSVFDAPHELSISGNTLRRLFEHIPVGTSVQNMARYGQSTLNQEFVKFDHGKSKNQRVYGSEYPPAYNLTAVSVPVVVIYGKNDGIVDEKDVEWLVSKLSNVKEAIVVKDPLWNHLDMVFSKHTKDLVYPDIQKYLLYYD